jgi:tRNA nucleotidyltransferase (CCA-adding enzyme)
LKVLEGCDAFRRPETLDHLLLACEADYRGRTGFERRDYPQAALFRAWFEAAAGIDAHAIACEADAGRAAEAIRRARIETVRAARRPPS